MKILIIDSAGSSLDWALRCQDDGHKVKVFIDPAYKGRENIGKGLIERVEDYQPWMRWADLVFLTDNTKYIDRMDAWRKEQPAIIAPNRETADWEQNRELGQKIFKKCGIKVPDYKTFSTYDQAIAYVKREDRRFVSKPNIDVDKSLSYVSKSPEDMLYMLERWKRAQKHKHPFIMQEFIEGVEMGVGGWFGPGGWNEGWEENFEFKKLMAGDLGVATGEQGTVLRFVRRSKLAKLVLEPLTEELERVNYIGNIDVNCIIDKDGTPWPLEFTTRPGWPAFQIAQALHEGDHAEWLLALVEGRDARNWRLDTLAIGVVLSVPDYPYSRLTGKDVTGIPIYGITERLRPHIHPSEIMLAPDVPMGAKLRGPCWATAGDYVLTMSATGETVSAAMRTVQTRLKKLIVSNSPMWRVDIGARLSRQLPTLQAMGYATGMEY